MQELFDNLLEMLRDERKIYKTEAEMARALNVPQQTLNDILNGKVGIGSKTLGRLIKARRQWFYHLNNHTSGEEE